MAKRRTWLWIIGGVAVAGLLSLVAVAGAGVYFISRHVQADTTTGAEATRTFDDITSRFGDRRAMYELDAAHEPQLAVPFASLPTAATPASSLMIQAWDPDRERMVRLSLPFWLLRLGPDHMRVSQNSHGVRFDRLNLDVNELARIGPALVLDFRDQDGVRVLVWTE